jgi:hypothetical protein
LAVCANSSSRGHAQGEDLRKRQCEDAASDSDQEEDWLAVLYAAVG